MDGWKIRSGIAEAILTARILKIPTLRGAYEHSTGMFVSDTLWENIREQWEWHDAQPETALKAARHSSMKNGKINV